MAAARSRARMYATAALALAGLAVLLLLAGAAFDGLSSSSLTIERQTGARDPTAVELDEARTREEMPRLAKMLDEAARDGRSTSTAPQVAKDIRAYIQAIETEAERPKGGHPAVNWRGEQYLVLWVVS